MIAKLVFTLAVYSFVLQNSWGAQAGQFANGAGSLDETVTGSTADTQFNYDLSIGLIQRDYDLWASSIKQDFPELADRIILYRQALKQLPQHPQLRADYVTLLAWNGQYLDTIAYYQNVLKHSQLPNYALNAVALSARESGNYSLATELYHKLLAAAPNYHKARLGLAAVAIRERKFTEAEQGIQQVLSEQPQNEEALSLLAFLYNQQQSKTLEKVSVYDKMLELADNDQEISRLKTLNLIELGLITPARQAMHNSPDLYQPEDWLKLRSAQNTKSIRRIANDGRARQNLELVSRALQDNDAYLASLNALTPPPEKQLATAYADRLLVLNAVTEHQSAITIAEQQQALQAQMPDYGLVAIAESYLAIKQANKALSVLKNGINNQQISSNNLDAMKLAYYAALDLGDIKTAEYYLQLITEQTPAWLYSADKSIKKANPDYQTVALMQPMHRAFSNDLAGAEAELNQLLALAPNNNEYRQNLADVLRWRGLVERSNEQLDFIMATDPDYIPSQISGIYNLMAHRQYDAADDSIELLTEKKTNNAVKRLIEDYKIATDATVYASTSGGNSSGSDFSSNDRNYELAAYSSLLSDHWRLFAKSQNNQSSFFGEKENIATLGFGAQYSEKHFVTEVELFKIAGLGSAELAGSIQYFWNDHLSLNAEYQSFNKQTPVRAFYSDVTADLQSLGVTYRINEQQAYSLSWQQSDFSDGNQRQTLSFSGSQQLFHSFDQRLTLNQFVYREENSADADRLYFNPDSALGFSLAANYQQLLYKRSDISLWHGLTLEAGIYQQEGFSNGDIWTASYQHQWQLGKRRFLNYSIGYKERIYDGQQESGPDYSLSYGVTF